MTLTGGLTKRELFAAMAMQALATPHYSGDTKRMEGLEPDCVAQSAVQYADALLAELTKANTEESGG